MRARSRSRRHGDTTRSVLHSHGRALSSQRGDQLPCVSSNRCRCACERRFQLSFLYIKVSKSSSALRRRRPLFFYYHLQCVHLPAPSWLLPRPPSHDWLHSQSSHWPAKFRRRICSATDAARMILIHQVSRTCARILGYASRSATEARCLRSSDATRRQPRCEIHSRAASIIRRRTLQLPAIVALQPNIMIWLSAALLLESADA